MCLNAREGSIGYPPAPIPLDAPSPHMPPASTYNIQPAQPDLRGTAVDMIHAEEQ